jgi:hypothetical protein
LRFFLEIIIVLDFSSFKCVLLAVAHAENFVSSVFEMFSASVTVFPLVARIRLSANAMVLVRCVKLRFKRELYKILYRPGPQNELWGHPLVISASILILFICSVARQLLKYRFVKFCKFRGHPLSLRFFRMLGHEADFNAPSTSRLTSTVTSP